MKESLSPGFTGGLRGLAVLLLLVFATTRLSAAEESYLIPLYDSFEDYTALMTPTVAVELVGPHQLVTAEILFSSFFRGRDLNRLNVHQVLMNIQSRQYLKILKDAMRVKALADGQVFEFTKLERPGADSREQELKQLCVWIPVQDFRHMAQADTLVFRLEDHDFIIPLEMRLYMQDLVRRLPRN